MSEKSARWQQPGTRMNATLLDQWERPWFAVIEKETGDPVGPINPQFLSPLVVPQQHIKVVSARDRTLKIDLMGWETEVVESQHDFERRTAEMAEAMYGQALDSVLKNPPPELRAKVGNKPLHTIHAPRSLGAGIKYALGVIGVFDPENPEKNKPYWWDDKIPPPPDNLYSRVQRESRFEYTDAVDAPTEEGYEDPGEELGEGALVAALAEQEESENDGDENWESERFRVPDIEEPE